MRRFRSLPVLFLLLFLAWAGGRSFAASPDDAVSDEIRRAERGAARASVEGSISEWAALYAEDVEIDSPGEPPVRGKEAAVERLRRQGRRSGEAGEETVFDVCGDRAVETAVVAPGAEVSSVRVLFWSRQPDGSWRIRREIVAGEPAARAMSSTTPEPPRSSPAAVSSPSSAPPERASADEVLAMPEPRGLSSGFVRDVAERLHSRAGRIRSAEASGSADARRSAIEKADQDLRKLVRDIGWIDVERFGTAASCDAAFIVAVSGDSALVRGAVPLMKDLELNPESAGCERAAREAFRALPPR